MIEAIHNRINLIKRQVYGMANFNNFCKRLLASFSS
ncbi:transposase [Microcoleus sp. FACHB-831]|nr:transposase [Microcoleus sp. FACHB-831]